ncbi:MAG: hypothetical protein A4E23_00200 [Methanomethylovorans sp. PtaU1.Bin073]|nr:MAG: hypothetical protein A4E23_00200 [Methanomethylovorans sp. PtaU1.Bin073]
MKKIYTLLIALTVLILMAASASAVVNDKVMTGTEKMMTFYGTSLEGQATLDFMVYQIENKEVQETYIDHFVYCIYDDSGAVQQRYLVDVIDYPLQIDNDFVTINEGLVSGSLSVPELPVLALHGGPCTINVDLECTGNKIMDIGKPSNPVIRGEDFLTIMLIRAKGVTFTGTITGPEFNDNGPFVQYDINGFVPSFMAQFRLIGINTA